MSTQRTLWRQVRQLWFVCMLCFASSALLSATPLEAKKRSTKRTPVEEVIDSIGVPRSTAPSTRVVSLTFKQMGAWSAVTLRGVDASRSLGFPIRADEYVVSAKLRYDFDYSPALLPELSHLQIFLNERLAGMEALPKDKGLGNSRELNLDPRWFLPNNNLGFRLIGHYTRQCEDPFHSSLWLTLSDLGRLELTLGTLDTPNDLKRLPAPFLDRRENNPLRLPFVFSSMPSLGMVKSAGVVSSWFGAQAGIRGAQFPVLINALPPGNAVVFMRQGDEVEGVKTALGANISVQTHPGNPSAKLLLVTGSTDEELERAARALTLIHSTLTGSSVNVTSAVDTAPRKPYDAPAWISTDRPVRMGELVRPEELKVQGYYPDQIRLNYRLPPDLFTRRSPGAPLKLKYRATRLPQHLNSSLNVSLNSNLIQVLPLNDIYPNRTIAPAVPLTAIEKSGLREETLFLPPYSVGGRDQLQMGYFFDITKQGECFDMPPNNLQGSIDPESTLDFSGFPHYVALPNLAYFANMGFPFTRMADLSETAVVLPERPNAEELSLYLTVMGRMGESTAYPSLRHVVVSAADVDKMAAKDLIVIGSASTQSLMAKWIDHLPMVQMGGERRVREPDATWRAVYRWEQQDVQAPAEPKGSFNLAGTGNLAVIMAFESPLQAARSVVFIHANKAGDLRKISEVLSDPERYPSVQGDFAVVEDRSVEHTKVSPTYYLGSLSAVTKLRWFLSDQPLLLGLLGLLLCILIAALAYRYLRRLGAKRAKKLSVP
jgi:hypothetical protein